MHPIRPSDVERMSWAQIERALAALDRACLEAADRNREILNRRDVVTHARMMLDTLPREDPVVVAQRHLDVAAMGFRGWGSHPPKLVEVVAEQVPGQCDLVGCTRTARARGLCDAHYRRLLKTGKVGSVVIGSRTADPVAAGCDVPGCPRDVKAQGWCDGHYRRWRRYGDVRASIPLRTRRTPEQKAAA